jgi:hypothetical protein
VKEVKKGRYKSKLMGGFQERKEDWMKERREASLKKKRKEDWMGNGREARLSEGSKKRTIQE